VVVLFVVVGMLAWAGATLLLAAWQERRRGQRSLLERLSPFRPLTVADEVEDWLNGKSKRQP
jgi:hypothetical protein